jgi:hypothetical protein
MLTLVLLLGSSALAQTRPTDGPVYPAKLPPQVEGELYSRSSLDTEVGPTTPLPPVKPAPGTIPGGQTGNSTGRSGVPTRGGIDSARSIGGGALPGGSGSISADPVSVSEREMRRMIRRLER